MVKTTHTYCPYEKTCQFYKHWDFCHMGIRAGEKIIWTPKNNL